jgi:hypothetical protein
MARAAASGQVPAADPTIGLANGRASIVIGGASRPMARIVTLTLNPAVDVAWEAEAVRPTRKIRTTHEQVDPGGGGVNVARVVHELGGEVLALVLAGGVTGYLL